MPVARPWNQLAKRERMNGYHPDWIGAVTAGVAIGLSLYIGMRVWPQPDRRKKVTSIAVGVGVVLAFAFRTLLRHFGI